MVYKNTYRKIIVLLMISALVSTITPIRSAIAKKTAPDNLTADDIIRQMAKVYAASRSYSDEGIFTSVFISTERTRTIEKLFKTAFIRPDRFRFEYREKNNPGGNSHYIVYKNGEDIKVYWNIGPEMASKITTLSEALAAAAGISSGTARNVPTMLIPAESQFRNAITFYDPQRIEDEDFDGVDCFRISDPADYRRLNLWIGKKDFLLRKMYREQNYDDFSARETTTYKPIINGVIKDNMLEFNSPKVN